MQRVVLFFIAIISTTFLSAQDKAALDSLDKIIKSNTADTIKVDAYLSLANLHYNHSPHEAIKFCEKARLLSEKINSANGLISSLGWLAYLYEQQGDISKALYYNEQALTLAEKNGKKKNQSILLNNIAAIYKDQGKLDDALELNYKSMEIRYELKDSSGVAATYNNIGLIFQSQGKIPEALDYYMRALKFFELLKDYDGIATALQNVGTIYKDQKQYDEALYYFRQSLSIMQQSNDKYGAGYGLNSIGGLFEDRGSLDSSLYYYNQALTLRIEINDKQGTAYSLRNIGNIYEKQKNFSEARKTYGKSLAAFEVLGDKWGIAKVTNNYGALMMAENDLSSAENYLKRSLKLSQELGFPPEIRNAAGNLQKLYRAKNDWKNALLMNEIFIQMRDSIENIDNAKTALKTHFKYDYEKKEAILKAEQEKKDAITRAEISKQKLVRNSFVGGFIIVLLFAGVFFRQRNRIAKEMEVSDKLLLNILPAEVAIELKEKGYADAKHFDEVTVMFTDFKGFTQIAEKLSAVELVAEIDNCFKAFDEITSRYNIEKIKTIGDAYMCAGGLPVTNKTNAVDVVNAAIEIRNFISQRQSETNKPKFEIRIGVHSGPVVAGIVGVRKFAYDIWGDTVNIAARMESSGEAGKVNISGSTYELVKDLTEGKPSKFKFEYRGKVLAKNKGEIDMYFVES